MATLYRCKNPTDLICACGRVARKLREVGIDYDEVRVPYLKRYRPEVEELTGQRWVPVLVHGDEVIHDSKRIVEYLEHLKRAPLHRGGTGGGLMGPLAIGRLARLARRAAPVARAAYKRWEQLSPEEKERYKRQVRQYAERGRDVGRKAVGQAAKARRGRR